MALVREHRTRAIYNSYVEQSTPVIFEHPQQRSRGESWCVKTLPSS